MDDLCLDGADWMSSSLLTLSIIETYCFARVVSE